MSKTEFDLKGTVKKVKYPQSKKNTPHPNKKRDILKNIHKKEEDKSNTNNQPPFVFVFHSRKYILEYIKFAIERFINIYELIFICKLIH